MKFLDIANQDKKIQRKIFKDIHSVINKTDFILGSKVQEFEKKFSKYVGTKYGIIGWNCE